MYGFGWRVFRPENCPAVPFLIWFREDGQPEFRRRYYRIDGEWQPANEECFPVESLPDLFDDEDVVEELMRLTKKSVGVLQLRVLYELRAVA
jgi:hypothetical protein